MDVESKTQLQDVTAQAAKELLTTLTDAKQFVLAQAPEIFQQAIRWQIAMAIMTIIGFAIVMLTFRWTLKQACEKAANPVTYNQNKEVPWVVASMCLGVAGIVFLGGVCCEGAHAIKAVVAPKLFLLDYVKGLLK
jgi:heme/copper-type cytochrome/quinol oxidase subunit 2